VKKKYLLTITTICGLSSNTFGYSSMQGYTGFINIPTANIEKYGSVDFIYSNQVSIAKNIKSNDRDNTEADDYMLNIGLLPYIEVGGRLSEVKHKMRDLSANIKFQIPTNLFLPTNYPKVAVGMQDVGGVTGHYRSKYLVLGDKIKSFEYALGYGYDSVRLDGVFGGLSWSVNKYIDLLAENDSIDTHMGIRINSQKIFNNSSLSLLVKKNIDYKKDGVTFALNYTKDLLKPKLISTKSTIDNLIKLEQTDINPTPQDKTILTLRNRLVSLGFENIDIGENDQTIYVRYENRVYNHNELDAIKEILKLLSSYNSYNKFNLVLKKSNTNIKTLTGDLNLYRKALESTSKINLENFKNSIDLHHKYPDNKLYTIKNQNPSQFKTRVELSPVLTSFVGTEVGVYDYQLSLSTTINWHIYRGLDLNLRYQNSIKNSNDLDPNSGTYREYYVDDGLKDIMLDYTLGYKNILDTLQVGLYQEDYKGYLNEVLFDFDNQIVKYKYGYFKHRDYDKNFKEKYVELLTYQYHFNPLDTIVEITGGKFWNQDTGYNLKLKKYFEDTMIYLLYQNSDKEYLNKTHNDKFIAIGVEIPLTPKKIEDHRYYQITGTNAFNHKVKSTISRDDGTNTIVGGRNVEPILTKDMSRDYYNRGRLSKEYIRTNVLKLII
jgi:hypothetical protein